MLTLKDKLQLFKLAKKPRKQIRLRLQVITNSLNLPSLHKTSKQLYESSSQKHQKAIMNIMNINNFKKIDKTKHNMTTVCMTQEDQIKENLHIYTKPNFKSSTGYKQNISKSISGKDGLKDISKKDRSKDIQSRLYHSNSNTQYLLKDFNFHMTREQKRQKMVQEDVRKSKQNYSYLQKEKNKESWQLIKLKNEYSGLKNMNKLYRAQLNNSKKIEKIAWNVNRMSQVFLRTEQIKDSLK